MFIVNALHRAAQVRGRHVASMHDGRVWTWSQVHQRVARLGGALRAAGIMPGDRVAVLGWNSDRYLEAVLSVSWIGAVLVPLNTRLASPEIGTLVHHAGAKVLLFDPEFGPMARTAQLTAPALRLITMGATAALPDAPPSNDLIAQTAAVVDANPQPSDLMGIFTPAAPQGCPKG